MERIRISLVGAALAAIVVLAALPAVSAALQAARPASCLRDQLGVRANGINGAAGTIHGAWVFTNLSTMACDLDGYPDLQLYGRAGRPMPTTVKRNLPPAPSHVKLSPGGSATFYTSYSDVSSGSHACQTSAVLQITPPDAAASLFIPAQLEACRGIVHVSAVLGGVHHP
ncbi:MAG: DUF4232 domain-containing protein [Actinomycetota bacterium]|nr:DUF4232 domain-containing protein [Actinomycetota bacterium]